MISLEDVLEEVLPKIKAPPRVLYHYCSQSGLKRIVEERLLSATNLHYFNDAVELRYARDMLLELIEARLSEEVPPIEAIVLAQLSGLLNFIEHLNIFVYCLSEQGDQLSQWRGYCPGSNGFSIGFSSGDLQELGKDQHFSLLPCIYDPAKQLSMLTKLLTNSVERFAENITSIFEGRPFKELKGLGTDLLKKLEEREAIVTSMLQTLTNNDGTAIDSDQEDTPDDKQAGKSGRANIVTVPEDVVKEVDQDDVFAALSYQLPGIVEAVEALIEHMRPALGDTIEPIERDAQELKARLLAGAYFGAFFIAFALIAPMLKHPSFEEEREWRLVSRPKDTDDSQVDVRPGATMFVPYFPLRLPSRGHPLKLKRLIQGPTIDQERALRALKLFLAKRNVRCESVVASQIPFRTW
jgi:hypothetical protein